MKHKLLMLSFLMLGLMSMVIANGGDKKKGSNASSTAKKQSSAVRKPAKKTTTTQAPIRKMVLRDTIQSPAKAGSPDTTEAFEDLFEQDSRAGILLNAKAVAFVTDYMEKNSDDLLRMKKSCTPYFNTIEGILSQYGLPVELKYLAFIESQLKIKAKSWAGAVGPWQFMPETARLMGLRVSKGRWTRQRI
ncbi:MAG: hypothetical protein EOO01_03415 [Chitinophagaceae bacterium]|nr:MAG: hypothetical protein EOO01_03415 [Chitinophagaceae bacterium]